MSVEESEGHSGSISAFTALARTRRRVGIGKDYGQGHTVQEQTTGTATWQGKRPWSLPRADISNERNRKRPLSTTMFQASNSRHTPGDVLTVADADSSSDPMSVTLLDSDTVSHQRHRVNVAIERPQYSKSWILRCQSVLVGYHRNKLRVGLAPNEALIVSGRYNLRVLQGSAHLFGAVLHENSEIQHRVYVPPGQPLPLIHPKRGLSDAHHQIVVVEISFLSCPLSYISELYPKLGDLSELSIKRFEVDIAGETHARLSPTTLWISKEMDAAVTAVIARGLQTGRSRVLICGPKRAGKSTAVRYLVNRMFDQQRTRSGIALLDLDPGQPEATPPGAISLLLVKNYLLQSPPATQGALRRNRITIIKSHFFGSVTPLENTVRFCQLVKDLWQVYIAAFTALPLIINTCGWVSSSGFEMLQSWIEMMRPTDIISFVPEDESMLNLAEGIPEGDSTTCHNVKAITSELSLMKASRMRGLATASYLHQSSEDKGQISWPHKPVSARRPMLLTYGGVDCDIAAIVILDEEISSRHLYNVVDGSVLGLVALESPAGIVVSTADTEAVSQESSEGIPFYCQAFPLPSKSRCLGQVLVRGIRPGERLLEVIAPISCKEWIQSRSKGVIHVLVRGKLDVPSWTYSEPIRSTPKGSNSGNVWANETIEALNVSNAGSSEPCDPQVPWATVVGPSTDANSRIWRVRRNLIVS